jgi:hypothetical protein
MTTLLEHAANVAKLLEAGHGSKQVFYRHGASGDCGPLGSMHVTSDVDDSTGPFDLEPEEKYVSLYVGN